MRGSSAGLVRILSLLCFAVLANAARAQSPQITPDTVAKLQPIWSTTLKGASRATPALDGGSLYVPNSNGYLYKIDLCSTPGVTFSDS